MSTVLVACGGRGTRLGYDGQKCLIPTAGRPFLHWKLDQLVVNGATRFVLLVAHHSVDVINEVGSSWQSCPIRYCSDIGTGPWDAVREARIPTDTFWVTWGDTLFDAPIRDDDYTSLMYITDQFYGERANLTKRYLDAGLYHVRRDKPHPCTWIWRYRNTPTYTINTPEQWEHTNENLLRYGLPGRDRGVERSSVDLGVYDKSDTSARDRSESRGPAGIHQQVSVD